MSTDVLRNGLLEQQSRRPGVRFELYISVLPDIADCRTVLLPAIRQSDLLRAVRRELTRYIPQVGKNPIAAVFGDFRNARPSFVPLAPLIRFQAARGRSGSDQRQAVLVAAAPGRIVDALFETAPECAATVVRIVPAVAAWATFIAGEAAEAGSAGGPVVGAIQHGDVIHLMAIHNCRIVGLRRFRGGALDELQSELERIRESFARQTEDAPFDRLPLIIVAPAPSRQAITSRLRHDGWNVCEDRGSDSVEIAARGAASMQADGFIPEHLAESRRRHTLRSAFQLTAGTIVLLLLAGMVHLLGIKREIASVYAKRSELQSLVEPLLARRDSLTRIEERANDLRHATARGTRLSRVLFDVSQLLPRHAHLTAFAASTDSIRLVGAAGQAAEALEALRSSPVLRDVQFQGRIRRELRDDSAPVEHFTIIVPRVEDSARVSSSRTGQE